MRVGAEGDAKGKASIGAVDCDLSGLLGAAERGLRCVGRSAGSRSVKHELLPAASARRQSLQLRGKDGTGDGRRDGVWQLCGGNGCRERGRVQQCVLHEAGRHCCGGENRCGTGFERERARRYGSEREFIRGRLRLQRGAIQQSEDMSLGLSVLRRGWCGCCSRQGDDR